MQPDDPTPDVPGPREVWPAVDHLVWANLRANPDEVPHVLIALAELAGGSPAGHGAAHELVALANNALPDGHPGKLTHADLVAVVLTVERLLETAAGGAGGGPGAADYADAAALRRVAAKLAALLPPVGT